jgi:inner membrane protein
MVGAVLGQMGLKRRSGLAMPTLIIAANIPDVDAACAVWGVQALPMRRGLTHGPIAMLLLPLVLTAIIVLFDRWQARRGTRPKGRAPVIPRELLLLSVIGTLSHPALDWLNSHGIRWLEPFSHRWFHGDTLFIIDVWIWAMLIAGFWWSRLKEKRGDPDWPRPARMMFAAMCAYIAINGLITRHAEREGVRLLASKLHVTSGTLVADPVPVAFWRRNMLWRDANYYGQGHFSLFGGTSFDMHREPNAINDPVVEQMRRSDPDVRAYLFWSRMPVAKIEGHELVLSDQRLIGSPAASAMTVKARIP